MRPRQRLAWELTRILNKDLLVKDNPRNEMFYGIRYGTPKKFVNYFRAKKQYRTLRDTITTYPYTLRVESVSTCNLHCPLCPTGAGQFERPVTRMSEGRYAELLNELGDYLFYVRFYIWGEPLLNKNLWRLIAMTEQRGIGSEVSSNLSVPLTDDAIDRLITAGLSWLIVSVDAATAPTYQTYRRGGNFDLVVSNSRRIAERKRQLGMKTPYLEWQFVPMRHNEHEIDDFIHLSRAMGADGARFKPARFDKTSVSAVSGDAAEQLVAQWKPVTAMSHDGSTTYHDFHCPFLWGHATVHSDGGIGTCCEAHLTQHDAGRLATDGFLTHWRGPAFRRLRRVALGLGKGDADSATPCASCNMFVKPLAAGVARNEARHRPGLQSPVAPPTLSGGESART